MPGRQQFLISEVSLHPCPLVVIALIIVLRVNRTKSESTQKYFRHGSAIWRNCLGDPNRMIANSPLTNISYASIRFNIPAAAILITRVIITVRNYLLYIHGAFTNCSGGDISRCPDRPNGRSGCG